MRIRLITIAILLSVTVPSARAFAQNWSFDARKIALGGVGGSGNLADTMIEEQRPHRSIVLPFGLFQVLGNLDVFDPNSPQFDPIRGVEAAGSPIHYVVNRNGTNSAEAAFVSGVRNATLNRNLATYRGFVPANELIGEGLASPSFGTTFKLRKQPGGGFQGIYVGAGPYFSMRAGANFDSGLTNVFASGTNIPNAHFPITSNNEGQLALAITGGYRGRFQWPMGFGSDSPRDGMYVAANVSYLHGFMYEKIDVTVGLDTDSAGLISSVPSSTPLAVTRNHATSGQGVALDFGVGAVRGPWETGFGVNGVANRINWSGTTQTRYSLSSLTSGNGDFTETTAITVADSQVKLPIDYVGTLAYHAPRWSALSEVGHGFGGGRFHGGYEYRIGLVELRAGARYTIQKWNPTGGIGVDLSPRVSIDFAAYGTNANIERKRQTVLAVSVRLNHLP